MNKTTKFALRGALTAIVGATLTAMSGAASATSLPSANEMSTTTYGDFNAYSLDLLAQCQAAGDPRCIPSSVPIASNGGFTATQLVVFTGEWAAEFHVPHGRRERTVADLHWRPHWSLGHHNFNAAHDAWLPRSGIHFRQRAGR